MNDEMYKLDVDIIRNKKYDGENYLSLRKYLNLDDDDVNTTKYNIIKNHFYIYNKRLIDYYKNNPKERIIIEYNKKYYLLKSFGNDVKASCNKCKFNKACDELNYCISDLLSELIINDSRQEHYLEEIEQFEVEFGK